MPASSQAHPVLIRQPAPISASPDGSPFAADKLFTSRSFALCAVLICGSAGLLSVLLGPDRSWDLLYYHLYAPWAYLHGRYLYDIGPAQAQGFLNPTADLLFYGLISSILNDTPRVIAFIIGAAHGINAVLVLAIALHVIRPIRHDERLTLRAAALVMGASGAGLVSLLGMTSNDLISSIFILGALLGVLRAADAASERAAWVAFTWPGLLAGFGIGLKYTAAVFVPALGLVALIAAKRRRAAGDFAVFITAALLGFTAVAGHHLLTLWQTFGNPVFPFLNQIFQSPYYEPLSIRDARFVPRDLWQLVGYPFYWVRTHSYLVSEPPLRDWRGAIAYVAIGAGLSALAAKRMSPHRGRSVRVETRGLDLIFIFVVVSYFFWALGFGIYRYGVVLEMLTGVVTMGALIWLFQDRQPRIIGAIALSIIAIATTVYPNWVRGNYGDKYVYVRVPQLPPHSIVLLATRDPAAYFIPFAEPSAQYLGIENNYLELSQNNKFASEVKHIMQTPGGPKFVVSVGAFDPDKLNGLLAHFGLRLSSLPCQPVLSNLEEQAPSLCRVAAD